MLWIWQKKSNNIKDLSSHIWDEWADENGSIGKAYGYQLGVKYKFPHGEMDQVDNVLWQLKHTPYSRRIMTNIYNFDDLMEMGLEPCAYSMTFNVTGDRLNAILNQRSQDILTANNWNVVQYSVLAAYAGAGIRTEGGTAGSRHRRRSHIRRHVDDHQGDDSTSSVSGAEVQPQSGSEGFLRLHDGRYQASRIMRKIRRSRTFRWLFSAS